jgi:hypothetical protein
MEHLARAAERRSKFGFLIFNQARSGHSRSESRCAREPMRFEMMP